MISKSYHLEKILIYLTKIFSFFTEKIMGLKIILRKKLKIIQKKSKQYFFQQEILNNKEIFYNEILNISLFEDKKILL